jgi:gamma-glutamyltranspeptidase/glutathione hydrolase
MIETPAFSTAAVTAPHQAAAEAGRAILAEGGNAIEAMVAMAATIAVVYPHMNGIGGDGFWLIREPSGQMHAIEACGPAASLATIARYQTMEHDAIPARGADAALTVAGAVGGWAMALDLAARLGGRLPRDILLAEAIRHAHGGYAVSASEARTVPFEREALKAAPGFAEAFLAKGEWPKAGEIRTMARLADTLDHLAQAGLDDFYRGDIGREIAADLARIGAPVTRADLAAYGAVRRGPLSVRLDGWTAYNCPPPSQGLAALLILGLFDRLCVQRGESFAHIHGLVEATKRAFAIRDRVVTDFDRLDHDPADFLTPTALMREEAAISMRRAAPFPLPAAPGDTVWMGARDGAGTTVSYIQSIYWEFGSGCVLPATGILWQNRGASFSLDPAARNPLEPGRKPFHTLNPALAVADDGRVVAYGSMGGDGQPQFQAAAFTRFARFGMGLADAIDAPRWLLGRTWGASTHGLRLENRFDDGLIAALRKAGHEVAVADAAYDDGFGHAGMLAAYPRGPVEAAHDPRSDAGAAGL